jgi:hypothetical protein
MRTPARELTMRPPIRRRSALTSSTVAFLRNASSSCVRATPSVTSASDTSASSVTTSWTAASAGAFGPPGSPPGVGGGGAGWGAGDGEGEGVGARRQRRCARRSVFRRRACLRTNARRALPERWLRKKRRFCAGIRFLKVVTRLACLAQRFACVAPVAGASARATGATSASTTAETIASLIIGRP